MVSGRFLFGFIFSAALLLGVSAASVQAAECDDQVDAAARSSGDRTLELDRLGGGKCAQKTKKRSAPKWIDQSNLYQGNGYTPVNDDTFYYPEEGEIMSEEMKEDGWVAVNSPYSDKPLWVNPVETPTDLVFNTYTSSCGTEPPGSVRIESDGLSTCVADLPRARTIYQMGKNQAVALSFDQTHFAFGRGSLQFVEGPGSMGPSSIQLAAISTSPGDFTPVGPGCRKNALAGRIMVDFTGLDADEDRICSLTPGQTYYFNIRFFEFSTGEGIDPCPEGEACTLFVRP